MFQAAKDLRNLQNGRSEEIGKQARALIILIRPFI